MNTQIIGEIEYVRLKMIESGKKLGLNHEITIHYSQQLDSLLNIIFKMPSEGLKAANK